MNGEESTGTKECTKCGEVKALADFYADKRRSETARRPACKKCIKQYYDSHKEQKSEYIRKRYQENREKILANAKQYREAHREQINESTRKRYHENPEKRRADAKQYSEAHKEQKSEYMHKRYYENPEKTRANARQYREAHREQINESARKWYQENREKTLERAAEYQKANKGEINARIAARRAAKLQATPPWYDKAAVDSIYALCAIVTKRTGIEHHVDHIVPLTHPLVSGLHCHQNMQVLTESDNCSKSNTFHI